MSIVDLRDRHLQCAVNQRWHRKAGKKREYLPEDIRVRSVAASGLQVLVTANDGTRWMMSLKSLRHDYTCKTR